VVDHLNLITYSVSYDNRLGSKMQERLKCNSQTVLPTAANARFNIIMQFTQLKPAAGTLSRYYHNGISLVTESQKHRITESQNVRGWKRPPWVI